jgi:prepilin-type N-terminal cleavage/methylation domain-containing protein
MTGSVESTMRSVRAFTLIELLVVIAIITVLMSMAMPVLSIASRSAKRSATQVVMSKVDTALRLFRTESGCLPYQQTYADTASGQHPDNDLYRRLGRVIERVDLQRVRADADTAAACYAYDCTDPVDPSGVPKEPADLVSLAVRPHVFRVSDVKPAAGSFERGGGINNGGGLVWSYTGGTWVPAWTTGGWYNTLAMTKTAAAVMLNRMAGERARLAVFSGNPHVTGCCIAPTIAPDGSVYQAGRDNSAAQLISGVPQSDAAPGWCNDYLEGQLEPAALSGDRILDAWGKPLAYVCQVTEGVRGHANGTIFLTPIMQLDSRAYGLARTGRKLLVAVDPISGKPTPADPPALADVANLGHSDRRAYASPGFEAVFELWSSGPDGVMDWMRDAVANRDNIGLERYDATLVH